MSTVRRSLVYSALEGWVAIFFQVASTVVIARLLTPAEMGVFAVGAVFASLASTVRDFGVAEYLIQEKELSRDAFRAALSVNIAISWLMAALLFLLAPAVAEFYRQEGVEAVMRVQSASFLLIPFGAVTMAWFRRELNFRPIFIANVVGSFVSFVVSIALAVRGHGYMSLAWSALAGVAAVVGVTAFLRPRTLPRWPGIRGIGEVVRFGRFVSGIYIVGELGRAAPELIIGRAQGVAAVGLFGRAYGVVEIFHRLVLRAIMRVCLPYFANGVRGDGSPVRGLLTTISYITGVGWVFLMFMAVSAYSVIRIVYGPQWTEAVTLAKILCAAAAVELLYFPAKEAMLAVGKAKESSALQVWTQVLRVVGLLGAIPFGLVGVGWGLLAAAVGGAWLAHRYLARAIGLRWDEVMRAARPSLAAASLAALPVWAWSVAVPVGEGNYILFALAGSALTGALWLLGLRVVGHPLWGEIGLLLKSAGDRLWPRRGLA